MASRFGRYIVDCPPDEELTEDVVDLEAPPTVSFCIPTYNSEDTIDACLKSIAEQDYPAVEIVVVDGHSDDRTVEIARRYTDRVFFDDGPLGSARQTSLEHSSGPVVALFDSDIVIPTEDWLSKTIRYFNYGDTVSTVWPITEPLPDSSMISRLYLNHSKVILKDRVERDRGLVGGGTALFLREKLERVGGIDRSLHWGEDFDVAKKLKAQGFTVVYVPYPVYHDTMGTVSEFVGKQFTGAETFTSRGFGLMNLGLAGVCYEQFVLGLYGMVTGILVHRDPAWLLFPPYMLVKAVAYAWMSVRIHDTMVVE